MRVCIETAERRTESGLLAFASYYNYHRLSGTLGPPC